MSPIPTAPLLEVAPELGQWLTDEERELVRMRRVAVVEPNQGELDLPTLLEDTQSFGAILLSAMLLQQSVVAGHVAVELFAPGDLISLPSEIRPSIVTAKRWLVTPGTKLALLDNHVLAAIQRWPRLAAVLQLRAAERAERTSAQLAICQLPRVADRVLAMMWLLAEKWGWLTPSGVSLPLTLTHDTLGALIGARRSTVTLALGELTSRGALVRQEHSWLVLEQLGEESEQTAAIDAPRLQPSRASAREARAQVTDLTAAREMLTETLRRMRSEHLELLEQVGRRQREAQRLRNGAAQRRATHAGATPRRRAP